MYPTHKNGGDEIFHSAVVTPSDAKVQPISSGEKKVFLVSSLGAVFKWYDFFLYGSLATIIGAQFFSPYQEATRNIFAMLIFAAGFIVRTFGALVFGRLGDMVGRKHTFLATFVVGMIFLPETKDRDILA